MTTPTETGRGAALVGYLERLAQREERGALAALRRGLGKEPGTAPEMFPLVERHFERGAPAEAYVVASLFGLHPHHARVAGPRRVESLGATLRQLRPTEGGEEDRGVSRRFAALLDSDPDALPHHLRHLVSLLRSRRAEATIDYLQLFYDLRDWDAPDRHVQKRWASGFWGWQERPTAEAGSTHDHDDQDA